MRYRGSLTIPANTAQSSPATQIVALTYGKIREVNLLFPSGSVGLVHVQVRYHERQILPTSPEQSFVGDDILVSFPEAFPIQDEPFEVALVGWSPGAQYDHVVYADFTVEADAPAAVVYAGSVALPEGVAV
jgi:hypothetical protein